MNILKDYIIPTGILPYAPRRPFSSIPDKALDDAIRFIRDYPESRGTISQALRADEGSTLAKNKSKTITMEAHVDATELPGLIVGKLVSLGFQPDTFVRFKPDHFSDHLTLKFKTDASPANSGRRKKLLSVIRHHGALAYRLLNNSPKVKEGYVELEIYPSSNKLAWNGALRPGWNDAFPLPKGMLRLVEVPAVQREAQQTGIALTARKHSDIHIKIARGNDENERQQLLGKFSAVGFYPVFTAAGNDVCTAQFAQARDAKVIFRQLSQYFSNYGGCSEMTWEVVAAMWRTEREGRLAAVPPLVMSLR